VGDIETTEPPRSERGFACLLCGAAPLSAGAWWFGPVEGQVGYVAACRRCVEDGRLGVLIGDCLAGLPGGRVERVRHALDRTAREAYRALARHDDDRRAAERSGR